MKLLSISSDAKTVKGEAYGYLTGILYLAPADLSGRNVCPFASAGCKAACLNTAGRGALTSVQRSRLAKTDLYFSDRRSFMAQLVQEIRALVRKAERAGLTPVVRLNGTSDIPWDVIPTGASACLMAEFPEVQFYDYTKTPKQATKWAKGFLPPNYHITFSLSESNDAAALEVLRAGGNVAAVLTPDRYTQAALDGWYAFGGTTWEAVDGDNSDLRFKDPKGVIVALKAKGRARKDATGFVRS